jgi:hypothetical protein
MRAGQAGERGRRMKNKSGTFFGVIFFIKIEGIKCWV